MVTLSGSAAGRPVAAAPPAIVEFDHVTKRFQGNRQVTALDDVRLVIPRGQMVSIIGPSGSGKSTLLNLVGGLDRPTSGEVRIDGEALAGLSDDRLTRVRRDKIGFIFQFFNLLPTLSCLENVGLPLHLRGWPRKQVDERARELLALVQLGTRMEHLPEELSGGERQRVAIARALSVYPPILLADEPTGNLDTRTGDDILALVRDLHARLGSTVIIVTHDMTVAASCPRTITLRDGRIVEDVDRSASTAEGAEPAPRAAQGRQEACDEPCRTACPAVIVTS
jgi:putative ABC transport system ATP-binding protein